MKKRFNVSRLLLYFLITPLFVFANKNGDTLIVNQDTSRLWLAKYSEFLPADANENIKAWQAEGLNIKQLQAIFDTIANKPKLYTELKSALSKYHRKVIIREFDFEGLTSGVLVSNSNFDTKPLLNTKVMLPNGSFDPDLTLSNTPDIMSFVAGTAELILLAEGTKLYRVCNDGWEQFTGGYWTRTKPQTIAEVIGGTAVQPEWNSFNNLVEYTVPAGGIWVWKGLAARQKLSNQYQISNPYLEGGAEQIFVPLKYRRLKKANGTFDYTAINIEMKNNIIQLPITEMSWK